MDSSTEREARRLRELFRGRFDQNTAVQLITELGGIHEAIDLVLTENEEQVSAFLKKSPSYLKSLRADSEKLATILDNKIEDSVRQFVCGDCKRSWWKRVPLRKEVSKCRRCHVAYDPIPQDQESGIGKFYCPCGKEFTGWAQMGETISECYNCGAPVPVDHMVPPRRDRMRKTNNSHSCNGDNCYNHSHSVQNLPDIVDTEPYLPAAAAGRMSGWIKSRKDQSSNTDQVTRFSRVNRMPVAAEPPTCVHPKSQRKPLRVVSKKHISTGSTVSTFLSQGSIDTQSVSVMSALYSIDE